MLPQNDDSAPADSPLGLLQRGRGRGWRHASVPDLLACLTHEPRWDRQVETRDDYYATLAIRIGVTVPVIAGIVRDDDNCWLIEAVVEALARRGVDGAAALLAEIKHEGGAPIEWPAPASRIDLLTEAAPVEELLSADWRSRMPDAVVRRLVSTSDPHDLDALRKAATDADPAGWRLALHVLALRGDTSPMAVVERTLIEEPPGVGRAAAFSYVRHLPGTVSLPMAREWLKHSDDRGSAAIAVLGRHATEIDEPLIRREIALATDYYTVCSLVEALGRLAGAGPFPELDQVYLESAYSYARARAVDAMVLTDPDFPQKYAAECLWDCEPSVRVHGALRAPLDGTGVARLGQLADDPHEDDDVREAAAARLH